ncbi:hypothetical protein BJF85_20200 [Saccharomonospora sp. CUA-673]|uniref:protein phosphatase 2C domain-containing protein n=1 Tax=Saccharomonospora sp. CUA-673 TaxID=1904969 RepID=UPI000961D6BE|nr:protein phosphatase 2C domain-containing protein [Saccharomonospora sp. CUA-673]OLT44232.1 hypothetical protein BJF85_20200 [Saccharomonospora sp. CUA-673]
MPRIETAEQAGVALDGTPRPSEDRIVIVDRLGSPHSGAVGSGAGESGAVAVLDGATEQRPGLPSGGWYAERLAERLRAALVARPDAALTDVLACAIAEVAAAHDLTPGASPSSTVAIARWTSERVEALVLADSPVVAFGDFGVHAVIDDRLARLGAEGKLRSLEAVARVRNHEGGFWVAEADPSAAAQAVLADWPRAEVDTLILATDGVSTGVDDYHLFGWAEVRDRCRSSGPSAVLDTVRTAERVDADRTRWPRGKVHDDQALVVVEFGAA